MHAIRTANRTAQYRYSFPGLVFVSKNASNTGRASEAIANKTQWGGVDKVPFGPNEEEFYSGPTLTSQPLRFTCNCRGPTSLLTTRALRVKIKKTRVASNVPIVAI